MEWIALAGRTLGFSVAAGVNLYATVAILGLAARYDWVVLPPAFAALGHPVIITAALLLYALEFVADKVPWVDSIWDAAHTFIRPLGGALIAVAALGEATPTITALVALLGGSAAAGAHLGKASTRVAVNASPEPVSNWLLSLGEDILAVTLGYLAVAHPMAALLVGALVLVLFGLVLRALIRLVRRRPQPRAAA